MRQQIKGNLRANRKPIAQKSELLESNAKLIATNQQLAEANARLALLATTDGLTGLKNHRTFQERLGEEIYRSRRYGNPLSLLLIDVDHFKRYNDSFGHPEGDAVLRTVAVILQETVRSSDHAARYGGEEFAVLLPETDEFCARRAAERIRAAMEQAAWSHRKVTVSIGAATFEDNVVCPADLITRADRALYRSKQRGRNCVTHSHDSDAMFELCGDSSLPYTEIIQEMMRMEEGMLTSIAERVKEQIISAYDKTIESWSKILDMKDKETEGHSTRVTNLTVRLARSIGMNEEEVLYARWGALLHDIGKIAIPDSILMKPGALTDEEWVTMRTHPVIAYEMLSPISFLRAALDIPYGHHEKWDGSGYPQGLKGDNIPITARLFAVIDVYDALRSDRPYRSGWLEDKVRQHLLQQAGTHFDPRAVDAFMSMLEAEEQPVAPRLQAAA